MSPKLPEVVLLDLDDTVVHFSSNQPNYWRTACQTHLPPAVDLTRVLTSIEVAAREYWSVPNRAFWGRQNMFAARRLVAEQGLQRCELVEYAHRIADTMTEAKEEGVRPIAGAIECLETLRERGHRLGLLTNGCSLFQRRKLRRYDLERYFELILVEGEMGYGKPDTRVFQRALDHFGVAPSETVMIGDNLQADVAGAQAIGIPGVWNDAHQTGLPNSPCAVPNRIVSAISELL